MMKGSCLRLQHIVSGPSTELRRSSGSTIRAYGAGEIKLPEVRREDERYLRYAKVPDSGPYTVDSVAKFLGWVKDSTGKPNHACNVAFQMLDAFDIGIVSRKELRGVKRDVAREIISKAMALHREQERCARSRPKAVIDYHFVARLSQCLCFRFR